MAHLSLALLGAFRIALDTKPVTAFSYDKVRALLAYLAVESGRRRPGPVAHRREALAGLLWPDWPERSARQSLSQALYNLREAIGDRETDPPFLLTSRDTVQFNCDGDYDLDVGRFEALATGEEPEGWEEAMDLYRGPFLEGFSLPDSAPFEEWARLEREHLQRLALGLLGRLVGHWEGQGEQERALEVAQRRVELAPWEEEAQRQLMRLLGLSGRRSAALAQYEACCRAMAEELDVEPSAETLALYDRIRTGGLEEGEKPEAAAPPHNLPTFLTPLIGREHELEEIAKLLSGPDCRLLTLIGPGGSGKTRLAVEAAAQAVGVGSQARPYEHGVTFVPLASLGSTEAIVPAVAGALGLSFYERTNPLQQLLAYLRHKAVLLVLDNYEYLLEGAGLVAEILQAAPGVQVVVTSRARLGLSGERLYPVDALSLPARTPTVVTEEEVLAASAESSAMRLFLSAAQRAWPDFQLTASNMPHVIRICRLVEGMPLGILLAAAWANVLQPDEIAAELSQSLDFLETEWQDLPPRQRSMRAVFDHSWNLLTAHEREVMQALSVFRGGFARKAAQVVAETTLRELVGLVNRSLLEHTPGGRYELHELLRQYAAEKLAQTEDGGSAVCDRHAAYYAAALDRSANLPGPPRMETMREIAQEIENALAAWAWAAERGQLTLLDQAMGGLKMLLSECRWSAGEGTFRLAAERLEKKGSAVTSAEALRILARIVRTQAWFSLRNPQRYRRLLHKAETVLDRPELIDQDTRSERAGVLMDMGVLESGHRREDAKRLLLRSLALYEELGAPVGEAGVTRRLSKLAWSAGAYDEARKWIEKSLVIRRGIGNPSAIAAALHEKGLIALFQGRLDESERLFRESHTILEEVTGGHPAGPFMGIRLFARGRFGEALQHVGVLHEANYRDRPVLAGYRWLCAAKAHLGQYEQARADGELAVALQRESGDLLYLGTALMVLSWLALAEEAYAEAEALLQESVAAAQGGGLQYEDGWSLACLGYAARGLGQHRRAWEHAREALRQAREPQGIPGDEIFCFLLLVFDLSLVALLLADEEQVERAVELYALTSRHGLVANSRWFEDVAGRHISAAAEGLPTEVIAAALLRGRKRDLWGTATELLAELDETADCIVTEAEGRT